MPPLSDKPSIIINTIYSKTMEMIQNYPKGDWKFMLEDEKDKKKIAVQIASIKEYLDKEWEKSHADR